MTGATGFIGSAVAGLLRSRGDEVVALVRTPSRAAGLSEIGCELAEGDITDSRSIRAAMEGCDRVIHGAAIYEVGIPSSRRPAMFEANVHGTELVLGTALELKVKKALYISTVNAFGNTRGKVVDETHVHDEDYVSYYDETKHRAHKVAKELIKQGLPLVIIQPGGVYGPGDTSPIGLLINQFLRGRMPAMMFPETGFNLVHRDDVAAGILLALDKGKAGEAYVLGGEITTTGDAIRLLAKVTGRKAPRFTLPALMMKASAPLGPVIGPALGFGPNLREIIRAADGVTYWATDAKARKQLGYRPRALEEGLRQTLVAEGRIPARARPRPRAPYTVSMPPMTLYP